MTFDVILLKQPNDGYVARSVLLPEVMAQATTEQDALEQIKTLILKQLSEVRVVKVEVDVPGQATENPWITKAGIFADDPTWDDFQKAMADHRQQVDEDPNEP